MRNIILKFGLISGFILAGASAMTLPLVARGVIDMANAQLLGYSIMVMSMIPVFLGVRAQREANGGAITFGRAFKVGFLIALISSACYVVTWEIIYFGGFVPGFVERIEVEQIDKMRKSGKSAEEIAQTAKIMALYKSNPAFNAAITFLEPMPVALIMSLVAAGILRRRPDGVTPATAVA